MLELHAVGSNSKASKVHNAAFSSLTAVNTMKATVAADVDITGAN